MSFISIETTFRLQREGDGAVRHTGGRGGKVIATKSAINELSQLDVSFGTGWMADGHLRMAREVN